MGFEKAAARKILQGRKGSFERAMDMLAGSEGTPKAGGQSAMTSVTVAAYPLALAGPQSAAAATGPVSAAPGSGRPDSAAASNSGRVAAASESLPGPGGSQAVPPLAMRRDSRHRTDARTAISHPVPPLPQVAGSRSADVPFSSVTHLLSTGSASVILWDSDRTASDKTGTSGIAVGSSPSRVESPLWQAASGSFRSPRKRTLNRFQQARAEKAFQGVGRVLGSQ